MKYSLNPSANLSLHILPALGDHANYIYVLHNESANSTTVVDPGEPDPVVAFLDEQGWTLDRLLITHHHWDHTDGIAPLCEHYSPEIIGFSGDTHRIPITTPVEDNGEYMLDDIPYRVLHVPGHTQGSIVYHFPTLTMALVGDTLFAMGCGRLKEGSAEQLWASLQRIMRELPPETRLFNGHEYAATNGRFALGIEPENSVLNTRVAMAGKNVERGVPNQGASLQLEMETNPFLRAGTPSIATALDMMDATAEERFTELRSRRDDFR